MAYPDLKLKTVTEQPYNAATPLSLLMRAATPTRLAFVRNHFERPHLQVESWRLQIGGALHQPKEISLVELQELPTKTQRLTLECAGNGRRSMDPQPMGTPWGYGAVSAFDVTGTSLSNLLALVDLHTNVLELSFTGADQGEVEPGRRVAYVRSLPIEVAMHADTMLVWAMNGQTLTPDHGFPLRLHVPGWYGMAAVKWLIQIQALTQPFQGFFQSEHYVYREEAGMPEADPVREMRVRSLIVQPPTGVDLALGAIDIAGVAWSGKGQVTQVEVSSDAGASWQQAELQPPVSSYAPQPWSYLWSPERPGTYRLLSRATDSAGETQPLEQRWNRLGYGNNGVQAVDVTLT